MLCSDASSVGVEWSGGIYYSGNGLVSAVEFYVVYTMTSKSCEKSEGWVTSGVWEISWVSGMVSANKDDSEALGPSWMTRKASDAVICSESLTKWLTGRTGVGLEALAVSDVKAPGAGMEADWNLETGRDWWHWHGRRQSLEELRLTM